MSLPGGAAPDMPHRMQRQHAQKASIPAGDRSRQVLNSETPKPAQRQWRRMQPSSAGSMAQVLACCAAGASYGSVLIAAVCSCPRRATPCRDPRCILIIRGACSPVHQRSLGRVVARTFICKYQSGVSTWLSENVTQNHQVNGPCAAGPAQRPLPAPASLLDPVLLAFQDYSVDNR